MSPRCLTRFGVKCAIVLLWAAANAAVASSGPLFHFTGTRGPHDVGLKVIEQYDDSRAFGGGSRPLQTLIWYPAKHARGKAMTVGDYLDLWATETRFGRPSLPEEAKQWRSAMSPTLSRHSWAIRDAADAAGHFPVIVYAPSLSLVSWDNADLCEYLASHGYIVLASPSMGAMSRAMTRDLAGVDAQARDISFLIDYARRLPNTDISKVAVVGYSWGGLANLFAAARDSRIEALVALDGSLRYFPGLVARAGDVHPERMTIPLLYFKAGDWSLEDEARYMTPEESEGANVLNAWTRGELVVVRMLGMTHWEFSSMYQRNEETWKDYPKWQIADYRREDGITGYVWMARYTLAFLDAYLKRDAQSAAFLGNTPAQNAAPSHFMEVEVRRADAHEPSDTGE